MRDFSRALAGLGAKVRGAVVVLRDIPVVAEVEAMLDVRGAEWSPAYEAKCAAASLALFGITEGDTRPPEPHPDSFDKNTGPLSRWMFSRDALASYQTALNNWHNWQQLMEAFDLQVKEHGARRFWAREAIDITNGDYDPIRCLPRFERQLYAAKKSLLPGARLTLNGGGRRAPQSAEDWGAALAAEAARFRPGRGGEW